VVPNLAEASAEFEVLTTEADIEASIGFGIGRMRRPAEASVHLYLQSMNYSVHLSIVKEIICLTSCNSHESMKIALLSVTFRV
jgi:hypothetical protein